SSTRCSSPNASGPGRTPSTPVVVNEPVTTISSTSSWAAPTRNGCRRTALVPMPVAAISNVATRTSPNHAHPWTTPLSAVAAAITASAAASGATTPCTVRTGPRRDPEPGPGDGVDGGADGGGAGGVGVPTLTTHLPSARDRGQ